jgi:hypothetical protein
MDLQYSNYDNPKLPQRVRIEWSRVVVDDDNQPRPDEAQDGFWPSENPDDAGYVGPMSSEEFTKHYERAKARMRAWENDEWNWIGVRARATIHVPIGGGSFTTYHLLSPGLWGVESDSGEEYLNEIFEDEKASLMAHLRSISEAVKTLL